MAAVLTDCDGILMLRGWEQSKGAEGCKYAKLYRYDYGKNDNRGEEKGQGEED